MAPPGTNADGTNTTLDDNIRVVRLGVEQTGANKRQLLAWRGHPITATQSVDDFGIVISLGDAEGDIRPAPLLMPTPFAATSRVRSRWIDTGASVRRPLLSSDDLPRGIVEAAGALAGPTYTFAGVDATTGYANYTIDSTITIPHAAIGSPVAILRDAQDRPVITTVTFLGEPAYRIELATAALGDVVDLHAQNDVELLDAAGEIATYPQEIDPGVFVPTPVAPYRILSHTDRVLLVSTEAGPLPTDAVQVQLRARHFDVVTNGASGLGENNATNAYFGSQAGSTVPRANVRIGFAFHQDPSDPLATRYPATAGTYVYDLGNPTVQEAIRQLGAAFVQYDILFDNQFRSVPADDPPALDPDMPRPELHFLRLPFRF
jgi:hypothetical protein